MSAVHVEKTFHVLQFAERDLLAVSSFWPEEFFWLHILCLVGWIWNTS